MTTRQRYVLAEDGRTPIRVPSVVAADDPASLHSLLTESAQRERGANVVAKTRRGDVEVSTVFLFADHRHPWDSGPPLLWETMVFGGVHDGECERWASYADAVAGHARMVHQVCDAE